MRLSDPDVIDFLSIETGSGVVVVTLVDDSDGLALAERLAPLQRKLNRYFDFIESGEVFTALLQRTGRKAPRGSGVRIDIVAKDELREEGADFLAHVAQVSRDAGISFSFGVLAP